MILLLIERFYSNPFEYIAEYLQHFFKTVDNQDEINQSSTTISFKKRLPDGNWEIEAIRHRLLFVEIYFQDRQEY